MSKKSVRPIYIIFMVAIFGACTTPDQNQVALSANQEETGIADTMGSAQGNQEYHENDPLKIAGTLVCAHCYALDEGNVGMDHQLPESGFVTACASRCADLGYPIAVLVDSPIAGTDIWVIRTSSQLFTDYMSQKADVEGIFVTDGLVEPVSIQIPIEPGRRQIIL